MTITVKYFASLRELMGIGEEKLNPENVQKVADLLPQLSAKNPLPENTLIAINQTYGSLESSVSDGDEVAFFPPVTGG